MKNKIQNSEDLIILLMLIIITGIAPFASDSYTPSLPSMAAFFHTSSGNIQLTITFFMLGFSLSQLLYGPLSDKYGRRKILILGTSICCFGTLLCCISPSIPLLFLGRLIQGMGIGVTNVLYRAIMRDKFTGLRMSQVGSLVGITYAISPALAPIIGGYIQHLVGWRGNFIFFLILISSTWILFWYFMPETNMSLNFQATKISQIYRNYMILLRHKNFISHTLCSTCAASGLFAYLTAAPFIFQNVLHLSPIRYGWLSVYITTGIILGQLLNKYLVSVWGTKNILFIGTLLMTLGGIALLGTGIAHYLSVKIIMIPILFFIIGTNLVFTNAMIGAISDFGHIAGTAGAMYGSLQIFGCFVTTLIVASLHTRNQIPLALIFVALGVCSLSIYKFLIK